MEMNWGKEREIGGEGLGKGKRNWWRRTGEKKEKLVEKDWGKERELGGCVGVPVCMCACLSVRMCV